MSKKYGGEKQKLAEAQAFDRSNFFSKVVFVTGCTNGIGRAAVQELMSLPADCRPKKLVLLNRNKTLSENLAKQIREKGLEVSTYLADLSRPSAVLSAISKILVSESVLDVALLNAGAFNCVSITERTTQDDNFEYHYAVNYLQCVILAEGLAPLMAESAKASGSESRVVVVGSFTAVDMSKGVLDMELLSAKDGKHKISFPNGFTYSQSKLAQHAWVKAKVVDDGGLAPGVTLNIVCPGSVETNAEVIQLLKQKMGCLYGFFAKRVMGQRKPELGCKTLLCAGGSSAFKGISGTHLTFGTSGKFIFNAPCDGEWFPQSKWALAPSIADAALRARLLVEKYEAKY